MDHYVTGATIKTLREKQRMTQAGLADRIGVSDKAVSKWETGRGLPDITLMEPLAKALRISVPELLSGKAVENTNRASNLLRSKIYVCPICGNVIRAKGEALVSCCGVTLPALEAEEADAAHAVRLEKIEDEYYVSAEHDMAKDHYLSFFAYVTGDRFEMKALYPEGTAEARFFRRGGGWLYWYCNQHGLFRQRVER
ncbi:MAG: helix-turn-helix domain-containing protein [Clostridia bacterium]|nr:helix-turn-helix domain-containing protein [Clostridia bacterium]